MYAVPISPNIFLSLYCPLIALVSFLITMASYSSQCMACSMLGVIVNSHKQEPGWSHEGFTNSSSGLFVQ